MMLLLDIKQFCCYVDNVIGMQVEFIIVFEDLSRRIRIESSLMREQNPHYQRELIHFTIFKNLELNQN